MIPVLMQNSEGYGQFTILDKITRNDGYGGTVDTYEDGADFYGVMVLDDSINAQKAESEGVTGVYTLNYDKALRLPWHTVLRGADGRTYRVTSRDEKSTPSSSPLNLRQVKCEEWELPA